MPGQKDRTSFGTPRRIGVLIVVLLAVIAWKFRDYPTQWNGEVIEKRDAGDVTQVVVDTGSGGRRELRLPKAQADALAVGDRVSKRAWSRGIVQQPAGE